MIESVAMLVVVLVIVSITGFICYRSGYDTAIRHERSRRAREKERRAAALGGQRPVAREGHAPSRVKQARMSSSRMSED